MRHLPAALLVVLAVGCPKQAPPPDLRPVDAGVSAPAPAGLIIKVVPADSQIIIGGTNYGPVDALVLTRGVLPLKPGIYQVGLKRTGYVSWRAEVTVNEGPETLQVTLLQQQ